VLGWDVGGVQGDAEALVVGAYFDVVGNRLVALLISMTIQCVKSLLTTIEEPSFPVWLFEPGHGQQNRRVVVSWSAPRGLKPFRFVALTPA
jgi:hypothetical protein